MKLAALNLPIVVALGIVEGNKIADVWQHRGVRDRAVSGILQQHVSRYLAELNFEIEWFFGMAWPQRLTRTRSATGGESELNLQWEC